MYNYLSYFVSFLSNHFLNDFTCFCEQISSLTKILTFFIIYITSSILNLFLDNDISPSLRNSLNSVKFLNSCILVGEMEKVKDAMYTQQKSKYRAFKTLHKKY